MVGKRTINTGIKFGLSSGIANGGKPLPTMISETVLVKS
jgi:hypothetical protein